MTLAPGFDMLNHNPKPNLRWKSNPETAAIELYALDKIEQGHELTLNYGAITNSNRDMLTRGVLHISNRIQTKLICSHPD